MDTTPFWAGTREQRLMLQYCPQARRFQHFPRPGSSYTGLRRLEWRQVSGQGVLAAWTVERTEAPQAARIQALVDLREGVRMLSWLVDCEPAALRCGMPVQVRWVPLEGACQWPAFAPAPAHSGSPS